MTGPARITIELEPARRGRWHARTRVESADDSMPIVTATSIQVPEPREPAVVPAAYEPPTECTCLEGSCQVDHANA